MGGKIELREGNWGEMTTIEGHLRGGMKALYSGSFLKYIEVIPKEPSSY